MKLTGPALFLLAIVVVPLAGCGQFDTTYGRSDGLAGKQSVNGLGAFRDSLEWQPDAPESPLVGGVTPTTPRSIETRNVSRLSTRTYRQDAIVWVPTSWPITNVKEVTDWIDDWMQSGDKTLVLILPDEGSTRAYWQAAALTAPPDQRLEYRRRLARQIDQQLRDDARRQDIRLVDWFRATALPYPIDLGDRTGTTYDLGPFVKKAKPKKKRQAAQTTAIESEFEPLETQLLGEPSPIAEVTTLARITHPDWPDSQLLVVSGGAMLTNFAMTRPAARRMTARIASEIRARAALDSAEPLDVGFLLTDDLPVAVSNVSPSAPRATGMELLTTWPLSLVTMHAIFLGLVMCLMLLPIFGRPRAVRYNRATRFGNHLDAMAKLMQRAGGLDYARGRISQYARTVRGETTGPWVSTEPSPLNPNPSPPPPSPLRSTPASLPEKQP